MSYEKRGISGIKAGKITRLIALSMLALCAAVVSVPAGQAAQVAVTAEALTAGGGFILEPEFVTLSDGDTAASLIMRHLTSKFPSASPAYTFAGSGAHFYISGIYDPERGGLLSEKDHGASSGWVITVNNFFINTSAGAYMLSDGDVVRWQYTANGGPDLEMDPNVLGINKKADKDGLIWKVAEINNAGDKTSYGGAYLTAHSVLKNLNAAQSAVDSALDVLNGGTDNGASADGTESEIIATPVFVPPSGVEAGNGTRDITFSEMKALGFEGSVSANQKGEVTVVESVFRGVLESSGIAIDGEAPLTPLRAFHTGVSEGATALVTLKVKLDRYDGKTLDSVSVFKMTSGNTAAKLEMVPSIGDMADGSFVWTDGSGEFKQPTEKAAAGGSYFISVAIKDDGDFDLDKKAGTIVDPLVLSVEDRGAGNGGRDGGGESKSGGGCDIGAFGIAALAALASIVARRVKK